MSHYLYTYKRYLKLPSNNYFNFIIFNLTKKHDFRFFKKILIFKAKKKITFILKKLINFKNYIIFL